MECSGGADGQFGPIVQGCRSRSQPDFTLLFEESILTVLPSCILIVLAAIRLVILSRRPIVCHIDGLSVLKLITAGLHIVLQAAILVEQQIFRRSTPLSIAAGAQSLVASAFLCGLVYYEHRRSRCPSSLILAYLFPAILFSIAKTRTFWLLDEVTLGATFAVDCFIQLALFCLESRNKTSSSIDSTKNESLETTAGPISKSFFLWLATLFRKGYSGSFQPSDLGPIDNAMYSEELRSVFRRIVIHQFNPDEKSPNDLILLTLRSVGWKALTPILPRLVVAAFTFSQFFLVSAVLGYLESPSSLSKDVGYGLIGACIFVYGGHAISTGWYWYQTYRFVSILRGGLIVTIFEKVLRLPEDTSIESKAMTLMISDVQRIASGLAYAHEMWAGLVETAVAAYLLQRLVGLSALSMVGLAIVCGISSFFIAKSLSRQQQTWLGAMQKRIEATSRLLSSFKPVKMAAAEERIGNIIKKLRTSEIHAARIFRRLLAVTVLLSYATFTLSPFLIFATYIATYGGSSADIDATKMFSSLVLVALLGSPLIHIFQAMPSLGAAYGCFKRIRQFLETPERSDPRQTIPDPTKTNANMVASPGSVRTNIAVSMTNVSLGWSQDTSILENISLKVKKGQHVAIIGRVGTGKSLLLKSIAGEAQKLCGQLHVQQSGGVAFCSQIPWLENISAEENWVQYSAGQEPDWQTRVHEACSLKDIASLNDYRTGTVGSGGVRLSGGQRQRIALARAVASRKQILLLDDVFSALDRATRDHISSELLGKNGLLRKLGVTVIYSTHNSQIARLADTILEVTDVDGHRSVREVQQVPDDLDNADETTETIDPCGPSPDRNKEGEAADSVEAKRTSVSADETEIVASLGSPVGDREVYVRYFQAMGFSNATIFMLFAAAFAVTLKFPDIWVSWWSAASSSNDTTHSIKYWLGIYGMLVVLPLIIISLWVAHLMLRIVPTSATSLHADLLKTTLNAPFAFMSRLDSGSLINRFNQDLMFVDTMLPLDLLNTCSEMFVGLIQVILIAIVANQALAILGPLLAVLYAIQRVYLRTSKQLRLMDLEWKADLHTKFGETCSGLSTVRANNWLDSMRAKFFEKLDRSQEPFYLLYMVQRWLQLVLNLTVAGLAVVIAGISVSLKDKIAAGAVGVAFLNATTLGETLTNFIVAWTSLETSLGAIARIASFEKDTPREKDESAAMDNHQPLPNNWPSKGLIRFENAWCTYNAEFASPMWNIRGLNLEVPPGTRVAICGRTGSGKSTMMLALLRMVDMPIGATSIDGVDISKIPLTELRRRLYTISQDAFDDLEPTTLRQQLDPQHKCTDSQLIDILAGCGLWDRVSNLGGLGTECGELNLSKGEGQILAICRLMAEKSVNPNISKIVLLDEATSSLDDDTETKLEALLLDKLWGHTVVSVLHRLDAAARYDKIAILENGVLVDYGDARDVVSRSALFQRGLAQ